MAEIEFNLLEEPWIRVMKEDCAVEEVSLTDALLHAHEYKELAGELPTQNAAVLRLLLAVLHAVFERVDANGEENEIEDSDAALDRWGSLWENGRFPEKPIRDYLESQKDNFWLFHPEKPFWQVPSADLGTEYGAYKLNGSLSESSNKLRLFSERSGDEKNKLTYSEAARWLLYVNAFDDTSAKPTKAGKANNDGKLPSPGAGWLGKIGYVSMTGKNLFESLMLNFVLLDDREEPWSKGTPAWELKKPRTGERVEIPLPNSQTELLTVQSRRLLLKKENGFVIGYSLLGGDFFSKENAFSEQMTVWSPVRDKKKEIIGYQPRRHNKARQMWRDFSYYAVTDGEKRKPGVINWAAFLQNCGILPKNEFLRISIASLQYGDKDFFAADIFSDELELHLNLLSDLGAVYRTLITSEISYCDRIAFYIGCLANDIFIASGGDTEKKVDEPAKEQFYYEIDVPFRKWLAELDANDDEETREAKIAAWREESKKIAFALAEKMAQNAGPAAFIGKAVALDKNGDKKRYYSTSMAMQSFKINMKKVYE